MAEIPVTATCDSAHKRVIKEVMDDALGLGPLEPLLRDPAVTEVMVNDLKYFDGSVQPIDRIPDDLKALYDRVHLIVVHLRCLRVQLEKCEEAAEAALDAAEKKLARRDVADCQT